VRAYRDQYAEIRKRGAQVVGVSTDSVETQKRFHDENQLPFPLLSDASGKVAKQYGGTLLGFANRATFVVERDGKVTEITTGSDAIDPKAAIAACPMPGR
jgi:peroxiredoxin Q/BCP